MLSATQLKNTKLKLQGKFKDKENDHEIILERHLGFFYVQVNKGIAPGNVEKDMIFTGEPPAIVKHLPVKKKTETGLKTTDRGRGAQG
jgi:hypothetical protein